MVDGVSMLSQIFWTMRSNGNWIEDRAANLVDGGAPFYDTYQCSDGRFVAVGALEPKFYAELCDRLGVSVPHDDDTPATWAAHRAVLAARFAEKTRDEWEQLLNSPGCCATPVLSLTEAPRHPHLAARDTFIDVDGITQPAPAPRFSRTRPAAPSSPALPGDHTHTLLREMGLDSDAVAELVDAGVVAQSKRG